MHSLEQDDPRQQDALGRGVLRDHTNKHRVEVFWNLNEDCIKDKIFKLKIDNTEVLLDAEQAMRLLRWV